MRHSLTIRKAARPTARISIELNRNGTQPPIRMPMNTSGVGHRELAGLGEVLAQRHRVATLSSLPTAMTAMKLVNRLTAAITAEPMAMPLVSALVVLPTASRSARIWRACCVVLFAHLGLVVAHLADAVGVVGHRAEHVHRDRVAGQGQHADAAHRHAIGDEQRTGAGVDQHGQEDRDGDDQRAHHGRLVADGEALDDVRGVAGLAGLGQALDRLVLGVRVVLVHLFRAMARMMPIRQVQAGRMSRPLEVPKVAQIGWAWTSRIGPS